jgi:hypothetical protein
VAGLEVKQFCLKKYIVTLRVLKGGFMELTDECIEEIRVAARKLHRGDLNIKIMARPEDSQNYDVIIGTEKRIRFSRALPTNGTPRSSPGDKY